MRVPDAEIDIDEALVRRLLVDQFARHAELPLTFVAEGWDNSVWRLGEDLVVRVPRREVAEHLVENELRWLTGIAAGLSLATPAPLRRGRATAYYPWAWALGRWIAGRPGDEAGDPTSGENARLLGHFFAELHRPAPPAAPRNLVRGVDLASRAGAFAEHLGDVAQSVDRVALEGAWARATSSPLWPAPPVWLHGDPHPANLVYREGRLVGVVDFGDLGCGDPAVDLAGGLLSFDLERVDDLLDAYGGVDDATRRRSAGWALHFGVLFRALPSAARPTYALVGARAITNALALLGEA